MRAVLPLCVIAIVLVATPPAVAQDYVEVGGTVDWLFGETLVLVSDVPSAPIYAIVGQYLVPVPGPRPTVRIDLSQLPQSAYAFMRPGERLRVTGLISDDGGYLIAASIIRGESR